MWFTSFLLRHFPATGSVFAIATRKSSAARLSSAIISLAEDIASSYFVTAY
jgi:hypothetical protein